MPDQNARNNIADLQTKAFNFLLVKHSNLKKELQCSIDIINTLLEKAEVK